MKFGIFYELSVPRPFEDNERLVYERSLEQVELADQLGFDQVWAVEHHFLEEYSHCSAPGAVPHGVCDADRADSCRARHRHVRTRASTIRSGSPSGPRCSTCCLAVASSWVLDAPPRGPSSAASRQTPTTRRRAWDEFVHALPKMWTQERYRHDGQFFSMPSRAVLPKPIQKPHPPMWVAVSSPGTEDDAADRGMGCLGVNFTSFAEQERKVKEVPEAGSSTAIRSVSS